MSRHRTETIEIDDKGDTWVRTEEADDTEPILIRQWYQLNTVQGQRVLHADYNGVAANYHTDGFYGVYHERLGAASVPLPHGGQTFSTRRQRTQLLPPKGYPKAMWHRGKWHPGGAFQRDLGIGREGKLISDITLTHNEAVTEDAKRRELQDAEQMASHWLYLGNRAKESGKLALAERHYARAQPHHDKMNRLLGKGDGSEA